MRTIRIIGSVTCFTLLLTLCINVVTQPVALAVPKEMTSLSALPPGQESKPEAEKIEINSQYPVIKANAGKILTYDLDVSYKGGKEPRYIEFSADVPDGFVYQFKKSYGEEEIGGLTIDPEKSITPEKIKLSVASFVDPGEYPIIVKATTGKITGSFELKAVITAKYEITLETPGGLLNTKVTAGKDNYFSVTVKNTGTDVLEKIELNSRIRGTPKGWSVTFNPEKIDSLPVDGEREVKINIKPPEKTISGDYEINVSAKPESKYDVDDDLDIRVTVLTEPLWGWIGIGIVVLVVIGLVVMFLRLGRR